MKKHLFAIMLLISSTKVLAFFCPTNFSTINAGDTLEQVIAMCGKPDSQNTYNSITNISQEWDYYKKVGLNDAENTKIAFIFREDKIISIEITASSAGCRAVTLPGTSQSIQLCDGRSLQAVNAVNQTDACGRLLQLGDSTQTVENACGKADFVKQGQANPQNTHTMAHLDYKGPPAITLIFENGVLKDRVFN